MNYSYPTSSARPSDSLLLVDGGLGKFATYLVGTHRSDEAQSDGRSLTMVCDDGLWCQALLESLAELCESVSIGHLDSLYIRSVVGPDCPIQGVIFEKVEQGATEDDTGEVFTVIGVTKTELDDALKFGSLRLLDRLKSTGQYPRTTLNRTSVAPIPRADVRGAVGEDFVLDLAV